MRRIVLLTSLYPTLDKDYTVTPVCHYFVKEVDSMAVLPMQHIRIYALRFGLL